MKQFAVGVLVGAVVGAAAAVSWLVLIERVTQESSYDAV